MARFRTIGHSSRDFETFAAMLRDAEADLLVDVRRFPGSRGNPDYRIETLPDRLAERRIGYRHMEAFGGRRGRQPGVPGEVNAGWRNRSFHNYADYALSSEFSEALTELVGLGQSRHVALMCAEAVWWRCHRRIIADYLIFGGHEVAHLMALGRAAAARPSPGARPTSDGRVVYPADAA